MNVKLYCSLHKTYSRFRDIVKAALKGKQINNRQLFVDFKDFDFDNSGILKCTPLDGADYIDGYPTSRPISKSEVFPVENLVTRPERCRQYSPSYRNRSKTSIIYANESDSAAELWEQFIRNSRIPEGYRHGGLSYAGFIEEYQEWCLPSWIWTNAALVRYYCTKDKIEEAIEIGEKILQYQISGKGWIVRNDYGPGTVKPLLAPNDSAYIANNACLELYKKTKIQKYLDAAIVCADWIINTARSDGMVYFGYDMIRNAWDTDHNIVDVGFTAGLFAELYEITGEARYYEFVQRFISAYIKLFYDENKKRFWSSIGLEDKPRGTGFSRGQAWALEGLIPVYQRLKEESIIPVINSTVEHLLSTQNEDGSWPRELDNPRLGSDCKGTPVIAYSLYKWALEDQMEAELKERAIDAAKKAVAWCVRHTAVNGEGAGGIYSFCYEGAIVHHMYTSTAFVYSSAYALETYDLINR